MATTEALRNANVTAPGGFSPEDVQSISRALNPLLADVFALYIKTKNFHWHMTGRHFRDYHLLLDEQASQIFAMSDDIAERVRKVGGTTLRSVGEVSRLTRISDNDKANVAPEEMLRELERDNRALADNLRAAHEITSAAGDHATTSLIENWLDETERRAWFLYETLR
ncbi:DNA starvation/stationary phase protection protein [Acidobacteria bacterium AB60]|nr:DNA starvation/stationary phase protection protein [Acidobacteria bacterium AB60]